MHKSCSWRSSVTFTRVYEQMSKHTQDRRYGTWLLLGVSWKWQRLDSCTRARRHDRQIVCQKIFLKASQAAQMAPGHAVSSAVISAGRGAADQ